MPSPLLRAVRVQRRDLWVALASFCLVGAVLVRVLAAPAIARTWPVGTETTTMVATDGLAVVPGTDLEARPARLVRSTTVRQLGAGFVPRGATAYEISVDTRGADDAVVGRERRVVTQLESDGTAVLTPVNREQVTEFNASGDSVLTYRPLDRIAGQVLRFPRDTPTADRMLWDPETGRAWLATYEGPTTTGGHRTLEFRQRIPATPVADPGGAGTSVVSVDRRVWVRPEVGAIVDERLDVRRTHQEAGTDRVLLDAAFRTPASEVTAAGSRVDDVVRQSQWLLVVGPLVLLVLGMLALVAAVVSTVRRRPASSVTRTEEQR
ncbi:MAG: porin PorA family protein [Aeromicrobium sp.]